MKLVAAYPLEDAVISFLEKPQTISRSQNFGSKSKGFSECFQHGGRWQSINMEIISFHCKRWFLPQGNFNPLAVLFLSVSSAEIIGSIIYSMAWSWFLFW
ncbi:hypothetical protein ES288_A05G091100v1 [Gossypium darwinii]|uniref:Uncharacterized protein n=1 Tax=Gossypium darwinii TaxID=34276 RepID=A0A5D2GE09_GOSDA|nr:hypothetical protein ES288_A05G091100v1 [Gossypium darwinii]